MAVQRDSKGVSVRKDGLVVLQLAYISSDILMSLFGYHVIFFICITDHSSTFFPQGFYMWFIEGSVYLSLYSMYIAIGLGCCRGRACVGVSKVQALSRASGTCPSLLLTNLLLYARSTYIYRCYAPVYLE